MICAALSSTFHGRDIFTPVGAHLAHCEDLTRVGPELPARKLVRLELAATRLYQHGLSGEVIATDVPYGNLVTNISGEDFLKLGYRHGQSVHVTIGKIEMNIPFVRTFSDVALGKPLLYIDSRGHLALAVNQGSFASAYSIQPPVPIFFPRAKN
jgi:S-adenosylmethionine hydrolase